MSYYLVAISPSDSPLYEAQFTSSKTTSSATTPGTASTFPSWSSLASPTSATNAQAQGLYSSGSNGNGAGALRQDPFPEGLLGGNGQKAGNTERHVLQMIAHSSLDVVEEVMVGTGSLYLRCIDKFNEWTVSAFVAPCVKFVLLHDTRNDDGIRMFFMDVWEGYVKVSLNPFHTPNTPIQSSIFESKIRMSARKNL